MSRKLCSVGKKNLIPPNYVLCVYLYNSFKRTKLVAWDSTAVGKEHPDQSITFQCLQGQIFTAAHLWMQSKTQAPLPDTHSSYFLVYKVP